MGYPDTTSAPQRVEWNGRTWYRSDRENVSYWFATDGAMLHRAIFEHAHGPIPAGHQVHHVNDNSLDNRPDNLEALTASEHRRRHLEMDPALAAANTAKLELGRDAAAAWHRSPEGLAWHSANARAMWSDDRRAERRRVVSCAQCGSPFEAMQANARFCSRACILRAARGDGRLKGHDHQARQCPDCGVTFVPKNRYRPTTCCSRGCAIRYRLRSDAPPLTP